jgi:hypothetical protein
MIGKGRCIDDEHDRSLPSIVGIILKICADQMYGQLNSQALYQSVIELAKAASSTSILSVFTQDNYAQLYFLLYS